MALRRSGDVPRTPARVPTQQGSTTGATSVSTSSTRKAEAGAVEILERERTDKADKPRNAEERAAANEQRALLSTDAREKRALTLRALAGYMEAAAAAPALSSTKTLGAQKNAERAAGSLAEMCAGREPDLELLARAIERSLQGDLDGAEKILRELASSSPAPGLRLVMRNALARIGDAQAALALDAQARALADAHTHLDPKATASKIAADILPLVEKHPHQALAAAALFLEATSAAGGDLGAAKDLIKAAGHAQSRARVPSVATKALPLAQASLLEGNTTGAKAAFHRVIEMSHASASEITAAQIALARIGLQDKKPDDVIAAVHELAKAGPVARGLGALVEASALRQGREVARHERARHAPAGRARGSRRGRRRARGPPHGSAHGAREEEALARGRKHRARRAGCARPRGGRGPRRRQAPRQREGQGRGQDERPRRSVPPRHGIDARAHGARCRPRRRGRAISRRAPHAPRRGPARRREPRAQASRCVHARPRRGAPRAAAHRARGEARRRRARGSRDARAARGPRARGEERPRRRRPHRGAP